MCSVLKFESDHKQNLCFFCYKNCSDSDNIEVLKHFKILADRHIGSGFLASLTAAEKEISAARASENYLVCCDNCGILLRSFCEIYDQLKYWELRLEWRLRGLLDIMKLANRVPSRVRQLKEFFITGNEPDKNELQDEIESARLKSFKSFRGDVMLKCNQKLSHSFPKMILERIKAIDGFHPPSTYAIKYDSKFEPTNSTQPKVEDCFRKWAISLVTIGMLLITPFENSASILPPQSEIHSIDDLLIEVQSNLLEFADKSLQSEFCTDSISDEIGFGTTVHNNSKSKEITGSKTELNGANDTDEITAEFPIPAGRKRNYSRILILRSKRHCSSVSAKLFSCRLCTHNFSTRQKLQIHKLTSLRHKTLLITYRKTKQTTIFKSKKPQMCTAKSAFVRECKFEIDPVSNRQQEYAETEQEISEIPSTTGENLISSDSQRYNLRKKAKRSYKQMIGESGDSDEPEHLEDDTNFSSSSYSSSDHEEPVHSDLETSYHDIDSLSSSSSENETISDKPDPYNSNCDVCKLTVPIYNMSRHFKRWHETNGQEIDSKEVRKCTIPECTAYFLNRNKPKCTSKVLTLHMKNVHQMMKIRIKKEVKVKKAAKVNRSSKIKNVKLEPSDTEESGTESVAMHECLKCRDLGIYRSFRIVGNYYDHQKFHKEGKFQRNFCEKIEKDIVALSMHEIHNHSNDDIDSTEKVVFSCPRCETVHCSMWMYIEHFADTHIPNFESTSRATRVECDVCLFEIQKNCLVKHFESFHDKRSLSNEILECTHSGCSAYFIGKTSKDWARHQLKYHIRQVHENIDNFRNFLKFENNPAISKGKKAGFICNLCGNIFASKRGIYIHIIRCRRKNTTSRKNTYKNFFFQCPVEKCNLHYRSRKDLKKHQKFHGKFTCKFCTVAKNYAPDLALHEINEHLEKVEDSNICCSRCPSKFHFKPAFIDHFLETHLKLETGTFGYCPICGKETTVTKKDTFLKVHFRDCHKIEGLDPKDIHRCDQCPAYFIKAPQLYFHKMNAHYNRKCPGCGKSYEKLYLLKYHMEKCQPDSIPLTFACDIENCTRKFSSAEKLDYHKKSTRHEEPGKIYKCSKCSKQCKSYRTFQSHLKKVHGPRKHLCSVCGKAFKTKDYLHRHLQLHEGVDRDAWEHQCTMCGKKFPILQRLEVHMRMQTNEKPFVCQFCGNSYAHSLGLTLHVKASHKGKQSGLNDITKKTR